MYDNTVYLTGHSVRESELRYTNNGNAVASFTLAVERAFGKKADGSKEVDFIKIEAWNRGNYKLAEWVGEDVNKGLQITVKGELHIDKYEDKYYTKVVADKVIYDKNSVKKKEQTDENFDIDDDFEVPF